jgi:hypothetical protein
MDNLSAHKIVSTATKNQQILLNWQGYILESTDTIFSTQHLHNRPATEWSHFFNSLFPVIKLLSLNSPEIYLPRIVSVTNFTSGIYDCSFMRVEYCDNKDIIVWTIFDYTEHKEDLQLAQQRLNEIRIRDIY